MMIETVAGVPITIDLLSNYFSCLVNRFFKILPMREGGEDSLPIYMQSLQVQLLGCQELIEFLHNDPEYMELLNTLQYLIDHPECLVSDVKREVFKCIGICNKLKSRCIPEALEQ